LNIKKFQGKDVCVLLVSNVVEVEHFRIAAEQIVLATKIQSGIQLIKRFTNYRFAIIRDSCAHIFRFVKATDFQIIAGASRANPYDWVLKG